LARFLEVAEERRQHAMAVDEKPGVVHVRGKMCANRLDRSERAVGAGLVVAAYTF